MSEDYQPLPLKYRPQTFEDVVGQQHNVLVLKNIVQKRRLAAGYIFSGSRGTGKTTMARIFARAINCLDPNDGSPCGECMSCVSIIEGRSFDVIELDAASHGTVDHVRDIKTQTMYATNDLEYRIYIIDEAHMMSREAFNAMLKLLEEPPPNTLFIFATTEPDRIPETIASRSLPFTFKRIRARDIIDRLKDISAKENISIDDEALLVIAQNAKGGMRDSISLLEQMTSVTDHITAERVRRSLGVVSTDVYSRFLSTISSTDTKGAFEILNEVSISHSELGPFVRGLMDYLRDVLLMKNEVVPQDRSDADLLAMKSHAQLFAEDQLLKMADIVADLSDKLRYTSFNPLAHLEIATLKLNHVFSGAPASVRPVQRSPQVEKPQQVVEREPMSLTPDMVKNFFGATVKAN